MWITTTTGKYFYDPHTDGEVPVIGQDWILPSGDNLGRVQSVGVLVGRVAPLRVVGVRECRIPSALVACCGSRCGA